jgi:hypothetical protein
MAKTKLSEYSATPASNTDINGINIDEGCAPGNINNAIREQMAHLADFIAGTNGDTLAVSAGGTGGTSASTARTALGLAIGSDVQAWDAQLDDLAGLAVTDGNFIVGDGTNWVAESGATLRTSAGLGTGNDVQFNSLGVGTAGSATAGEIRATNNVTAYYSSDERLKENIRPIENALGIIEQLNGVRYEWTQDYIDNHGGEDGYFIRKDDVGMIAQEVEAVLPELVVDRNDGYKAMKYDRLVAVLIQAVKELKAEVDELKG